MTCKDNYTVSAWGELRPPTIIIIHSTDCEVFLKDCMNIVCDYVMQLKIQMFYWPLGKDIVELKSENKWGSGFLKNLSQDLTDALLNQHSFSPTNLGYMRRFYLLYMKICPQVGEKSDDKICPQLEDKLFSIHGGIINIL